MLLAVCWQISVIFLRGDTLFFTEGLSVIYLGLLNIHILCTDGE